ncbi:hypothetical protein FE391_23955 [Nonomuraea sp. KC401]|uniref:hypothetical protein n=1 Tax=unclassified Nonomuraea TaxID=2593643 RepID=UPI0010FE9275|nr:MULTISPECIES: hypothetical protein [unclassified Nonomuraea]NBE96798.1 hypothetical protein [Nonomuraea sp. K271]TLF67925.1 hypothetical protein FE391_23955 [Nonomuraea sp. KC401]
MGQKPRIGLSITLVAALGMAGCASGETPEPSAATQARPSAASPAPPTTAAPNLVPWIDRVCAATRLFRDKPKAPSTKVLDDSVPDRVAGDFAALALLEMASHLDFVADTTRASADLLEEAGPGPAEGGAEMVAGYHGALRRMLPKVERHRVKNKKDYDGIGKKVRQVSKLVAALKTDGPDLDSLVDRNPALSKAYAEAVNCGADGMFPRPGEGVPTPKPG